VRFALLRATWLVVAALLALPRPGATGDGDVERLRAENARLEARVRELEAENASLRSRVGTVEAAANRSVTTSVDEKGVLTSLDLEPSRLELTGGNRSRHWIALHAERRKDAAAATIEIEAAASNGAYRAVRQLELSLDGASLTLPVTTRTAVPILAGPQQQRVGEREAVKIAAPADAVARIGAAREVRGRLGPTSFVLTPEQIASFGAVARRLGSEGP
jgi:cell division protein FtsB